MTPGTETLSSLRSIGGKVLRIRPYQYPAEWMAGNCFISGAINGTGIDQPFDPWHFPCNVGIVDAFAEGKRGVLVQKSVQMGVSHYFQNLVMYCLARVGGPAGYFMAKDETMRDHLLERIMLVIEKSPELAELRIIGKDDHSTMRSLRFLNGSLKLFGSGSVNNFKSNPYRHLFGDEFELIPVFPDGSDGVLMAKGRQASFSDPFFAGFSTPGEAESDRGIEKSIERDSDMRRFFWRCPHCDDPIAVNFLDNVSFDRDPGTNRIIHGTAKLLCPKCSGQISDSERAAALLHAAQAACPWYTAVPYDDQVGWVSTLPAETAAAREYVGIMDLDHLHNPRKHLSEMASQYTAISSEPERKTFWNDVLGRGYTVRAQQLTRGDVTAHLAEARRTTVPAETMWITCGIDVQGAGADPHSVTLYYDISAWVRVSASVIRKVTLVLDRMVSSDSNGHDTIKQFLRTWSTTDTRGNPRTIDMVVMDSGQWAPTVNAICNALSGRGVQWAIPCVYGSHRLTDPDYELRPQSEAVGDPSKAFLFTHRNFAIGRYVNLVVDERNLIELPDSIDETVIAHYLANECVKKPDAHGVMRDVWQKKKDAGGRNMADDYFSCGVYSLLAAIQLGYDSELSADITEAAAAAERVESRRIEQRAARNAAEQARRQRMRSKMRSHYSGRG